MLRSRNDARRLRHRNTRAATVSRMPRADSFTAACNLQSRQCHRFIASINVAPNCISPLGSSPSSSGQRGAARWSASLAPCWAIASLHTLRAFPGPNEAGKCWEKPFSRTCHHARWRCSTDRDESSSTQTRDRGAQDGARDSRHAFFSPGWQADSGWLKRAADWASRALNLQIMRRQGEKRFCCTQLPGESVMIFRVPQNLVAYTGAEYQKFRWWSSVGEDGRRHAFGAFVASGSVDPVHEGIGRTNRRCMNSGPRPRASRGLGRIHPLE